MSMSEYEKPRWNQRPFEPEIGRLAATQRLTAKGVGIVAGAVTLAVGLGMSEPLPNDESAQDASLAAVLQFVRGADTLSGLLASTRSQLAEAQLELDRANALIHYSARYRIAADMAVLIYDTAVQEKIEPEIAFRLVRVESAFNTRAVSSAGALGLAQVMPKTARQFIPELQDEELFNRELNVQIGFRYLHDLIVTFEGNLPMALIAYNRGPSRLRQLLAGGIAPWNGYASSVLDGLTGYDEIGEVLAAGTQ